jgi:hypothetical protein
MNEKELAQAVEFIQANPEFAFECYGRYLEFCEQKGEEPDDPPWVNGDSTE